MMAFLGILYAYRDIFFSPFSLGRVITFGLTEDLTNLLAVVGGSIAGVVGSVYFKAGRLTVRLQQFVRPLACTPLTLIPLLKLVEGLETITVLGIATLMVTSYQVGFFWERLLAERSAGG